MFFVHESVSTGLIVTLSIFSSTQKLKASVLPFLLFETFEGTEAYSVYTVSGARAIFMFLSFIRNNNNMLFLLGTLCACPYILLF